MSDFREGDLVEISMGEEFARVRVGGELWKNIKNDLADWELELLHTVKVIDRPVELPTEPGTVIAIGEWWLVRLRSYEGAPPAWEFLPLPSKAENDRLARLDVATQCVYGDDWVRAWLGGDGSGYKVVSAPVPASDQAVSR